MDKDSGAPLSPHHAFPSEGAWNARLRLNEGQGGCIRCTRQSRSLFPHSQWRTMGQEKGNMNGRHRYKSVDLERHMKRTAARIAWTRTAGAFLSTSTIGSTSCKESSVICQRMQIPDVRSATYMEMPVGSSRTCMEVPLGSSSTCTQRAVGYPPYSGRRNRLASSNTRSSTSGSVSAQVLPTRDWSSAFTSISVMPVFASCRL